MTDRQPIAFYAIYNSPADFPGRVVVRKWLIGLGLKPVPTDEIAIVDSVEEAREFLPLGLVCFTRHELDDPCIVEMWL